MRLYKCYSCDIVYEGDQWNQKCPQCGNYGVENDAPARFYKCYSCDIVFAGDQWHQKCPKCGNYGNEI